ncbi:MAG: hypothetical protein ACREPX_10995 [Rhodanobacteraceae bacterium]
MPTSLIDTIPMPLLALGTLALVLIALEIGFRIGRWRRTHSGAEHDTTLGGVVGATLGLVAFLLAFTFGMAAERFEDRRQVLLEEVNALDAAYLRADLIGEPFRSEAHGVLRQYVALRLEEARRDDLGGDIQGPETLQDDLWDQVVAMHNAGPSSATKALFVQAINTVIDVQNQRTDMARHPIPPTIWIALYLITMVAMAKVGYQSGVSGPRRSAAMPTLSLTFTLVFVLIADLDRPLRGLLRVSQQSMIDLQEKMAAHP